jgi:isopentenyl phosphate kinase
MAAQKDFDLSQFETVDTATLTVLNPKGDELLVNGDPVKITVYGPGSKQHLKAKHVLDNAVQVRSMAMLRGKVEKNMAELSAQQTAEFLAACTVSVENFPIEGGAIAIYSNPKLKYITDQVDKFLGDTENFMPGSQTK